MQVECKCRKKRHPGNPEVAYFLRAEGIKITPEAIRTPDLLLRRQSLLRPKTPVDETISMNPTFIHPFIQDLANPGGKIGASLLEISLEYLFSCLVETQGMHDPFIIDGKV